jgi:hypothetical protein
MLISSWARADILIAGIAKSKNLVWENLEARNVQNPERSVLIKLFLQAFLLKEKFHHKKHFGITFSKSLGDITGLEQRSYFLEWSAEVLLLHSVSRD